MRQVAIKEELAGFGTHAVFMTTWISACILILTGFETLMRLKTRPSRHAGCGGRLYDM